MNWPRCDDGGNTSRDWDDATWFAVEDAILTAIGRCIRLDELPRAVDLRWPGLVPLVLLVGHPLSLELVWGALPTPIPIGPDVLGVLIEEDPNQLGSVWRAVLAREPAIGTGACPELRGDCLEHAHGWSCPWAPERQMRVRWAGIIYYLGDPCSGLGSEISVRMPCAMAQVIGPCLRVELAEGGASVIERCRDTQEVSVAIGAVMSSLSGLALRAPAEPR